MAPKMAAILIDVTVLQQRGNPYYVPHLAEHITGFLLQVKSFQNTVT